MKFFQQCFAVNTRNDHSCPPHETAIMDADFISSLEVGLEAFVVFVMWKSLSRPDEDL